jgi:hypothetical protein
VNAGAGAGKTGANADLGAGIGKHGVRIGADAQASHKSRPTEDDYNRFNKECQGRERDSESCRDLRAKILEMR